MTRVELCHVDTRQTNAIKWTDFEHLKVLLIAPNRYYDPDSLFSSPDDYWDGSIIKLSTIRNSNLKSLTLQGPVDIDGKCFEK